MSIRRKKDAEEPEGAEPEAEPETGTTIETDWVTPEAVIAASEVAAAPAEPEPEAEPEAVAEPAVEAVAPEPEPEPEPAPEAVTPVPEPEPESVFVPPLPLADEPYVSPWDEPAAAGSPATGGLAAERPEALVGAAFAGGVLAAMILRRLGR